MCDITLSLPNEDKDLLMTVTQVEGQPKVNLKKMQKAFKSSPYSTFLLIEDSMESLLTEVNKAKTDENDDKSEDDETKEKKEAPSASAIIANAIDSTVTVSLSPDNMSATIEIKAGYGGLQPKESSVLDILKENNVIKGIIKDNLVNTVQQSIRLKGGKSISAEIALGNKSVNGKNGYIKYLVADPIERVLRPKLLENGNVDMHELGDLVHVKKGKPLAKLIPPTAGIAGFNVLGDIVEATPGEPYSIKEAEGSSFSNEHNNMIIANTDGMPKHLDDSVAVHKLLEIENIDVSSGNIRFDGSVFVKGNVCEGMELSASEDIIIGGIVESAMIVAGGNIAITQGIIGKKVAEDNKYRNSSILQAKGNINAQFVQYADIFAKNNINIIQYISHSQVIIQGNLWVGKIEDDKADGKVFGSLVQSGGLIHVGTLGSTSGAKTKVDFNYWANHVEELRIKADEESIKIMRRLPKIYKLLSSANTQADDKTPQKDRIIKALKQHLILLGTLNQAWLEKQENISEHLAKLELLAYKAIRSGVDVSVSSKNFAFKRDYEATKIQWLENDINIESIVI